MSSACECFHPLQAYQGSDGLVRFFELGGDRASVRSLLLRCGQCVGCRLDRSRQWAIRCVHESKLYERNSFVTLTYADVPSEDSFGGKDSEAALLHRMSLQYRDFQLFMRRLRKVRTGVRFFMCGEYGDTTGRPHFHACLFNCDFPDRVYHKRSESGANVYRSPELESLWSAGFSTVGDLTFESAAYCARYVMKKLTGDGESVYYDIFDPSSGEIWRRAKEFCHMSLKPGIASDWLRLFWPDVVDGKVIVNGVPSGLPKFYKRRLRQLERFQDGEFARVQEMRAQFLDNTDARLAVKEEVALARVSLLKRTL